MAKLKAEGREAELGEGSLHGQLVKKLSSQQVESYSHWLNMHSKIPSVTNLSDWLKKEVAIKIEAAEMAHGLEQKPLGDPQFKRGNGSRPRTFFTEVDKKSNQLRPPCQFCGQDSHPIWYCKKYETLAVDQRWKTAKEKALCFRCLSKDHHGKDCRRTARCGVDGCSLSHHHLLHDPERKKGNAALRVPVNVSGPQREVVTTPKGSDPPREGASPVKGCDPPGEGARANVTTTMNTKSSVEAYSLRTVPVWVKANGRKMKVNAVLDDASNETFMNEELTGALGLSTSWKAVQVHVLNSSVETFRPMPLQVEIESVDGQFSKTVNVQTCPKEVTGNYRVVDWSKFQSDWPHLSQCSFPTPAKDELVDVLIGVDNPEMHFSMVDFQGDDGGPVARLGSLGWTCIGPPKRQEESVPRSHSVRSLLSRGNVENAGEVSCCDLDRTLKGFWAVEDSGVGIITPQVMTEEERAALEKVKNSCTIVEGRYQVGAPWKRGQPNLPDNRAIAQSRLVSTEKNLRKSPIVAEEYCRTVKEYVEKGYLRKVNPNQEKVAAQWYLPHFPVVRLDKSTTKVRIVFDCSAKCDGVSLNDEIHAGPKLQQNLFDVLLRFRRDPVAVACDIKEMYMQISIEEQDRPYFRMLWRDLNADQDPEVYEFSRIVFGKNSAPMEAQFVVQENARKHQGLFPLAAETILKSTYMDDSLDSAENDDQGIRLYHELKDLWAKANMQARKWVSNSSKVMAEIPEEDRAVEMTISEDNTPTTKTLGLSWNSKDDMLTIPMASPPRLQITKRNVLRKIATVFDPLGFISPFAVIAKMLLQELWSRGYGWDDEIQDELAIRIVTWFNQLESLSTIAIPRCLRFALPVKKKEIVTFVDASKAAYGAVSYLRTSMRMIKSVLA